MRLTGQRGSEPSPCNEDAFRELPSGQNTGVSVETPEKLVWNPVVIQVSLRRACILLLAIACLGFELRHSPQDLFFPAEARLAGTAAHDSAAILREAVTRGQVLTQGEPSASEKGYGAGDALPARHSSGVESAYRHALASSPPHERFRPPASFHRARAPPLSV
jgi:hypothetical protein